MITDSWWGRQRRSAERFGFGHGMDSLKACRAFILIAPGNAGGKGCPNNLNPIVVQSDKSCELYVEPLRGSGVADSLFPR